MPSFSLIMSRFKKAKIYVLQYDARDSPIMNRYILFNVAFSLVVQDKHIFDTNDILFWYCQLFFPSFFFFVKSIQYQFQIILVSFFFFGVHKCSCLKFSIFLYLRSITSYCYLGLKSTLKTNTNHVNKLKSIILVF